MDEGEYQGGWQDSDITETERNAVAVRLQAAARTNLRGKFEIQSPRSSVSTESLGLLIFFERIGSPYKNTYMNIEGKLGVMRIF